MTQVAQGEESSPWEAVVRRRQQYYLQYLGDRLYDSYRRRLKSICKLLSTEPCQCYEYDGLCYNNSEINTLKKKIGFALFGELINIDKNNKNLTKDSKKKLKLIECIFNQVLKLQNEDVILMSILFVSVNTTSQDGNGVEFPVFRVPKLGNDYLFIDFQGRLYQDWDSFIANNKLPTAQWAYPKDGVYTMNSEGQVELCFGYTPAAKLGQRAIKVMDTASSVLSLGAGAGVFFPPVYLPCAVACGALSVYGIVRGSCELADRGKHKQSLNDREAFSQWLSLAGSTLGLGSSGAMVAIRTLAKEGKIASDVLIKICDGINGSSILVNGVSIVDNVLTIKEAEEWHTLQIFQLIASVLFFAHSVVSFKTARALIEESELKESNAFFIKRKETNNIRHLSVIANKSDFLSQITLQNTATSVIRVHEPQVFTKIKQMLNNLGPSDMKYLMNIVDGICQRWEHGPYFMRALRIATDIFKCRDLSDAKKIVQDLIQFANDFCRSIGTSNEEESINNIKNIEFIPSCIIHLSGSSPNEEVYHFPEHHRAWGRNGELEAEEYILIGSNAFGLTDIPPANVEFQAGTACVYFEQVGFVKIESFVEEQKIVISKFKNGETEIVHP